MDTKTINILYKGNEPINEEYKQTLIDKLKEHYPNVDIEILNECENPDIILEHRDENRSVIDIQTPTFQRSNIVNILGVERTKSESFHEMVHKLKAMDHQTETHTKNQSIPTYREKKGKKNNLNARHKQYLKR